MSLNDEAVQSVTRHANEGNLQKYANQSRETERFSDVCIKTGNISFPAHRLVLSCYSQFFEKLFLAPMREQHQGIVELNELDGEAVKTLVDFMYTRVIIIDYNNVFDLLTTAHFLQMNEVCEFCFEYLTAAINIDNWCSIFLTCNLYENDLLLEKLHQFICENLKAIAQSASFKELQIEKLTSIVQNRDIDTGQSMYEAIISWIRHDEENREKNLPELFLLLDLHKITCEFLENIVARDPFVKKNVECMNMMIAAFITQLKNIRDKEATKVISVGGVYTRSKVVEVYNKFGESNTVYPDLPYQLFYSKHLLMHKSIYSIGGSVSVDEQSATDNVYQLKNMMHWEKIAPMNEKRASAAAVVFKDCIVVAGGEVNETILCSSELYIPAINKWMPLPNLNGKRSGAELVECDGSLYALGGINGQEILSSVERLNDLEGSEWEFSESMKSSRFLFAAVSCNREIFVMGGGCSSDNQEVILQKTVEKFNPTDKKWTSVSDMKIERHGHAACLLNGKIYVVGGLDLNKKLIKLIECYDPSTDKWTDIGEAKHEFYTHSLLAL